MSYHILHTCLHLHAGLRVLRLMTSCCLYKLKRRPKNAFACHSGWNSVRWTQGSLQRGCLPGGIVQLLQKIGAHSSSGILPRSYQTRVHCSYAYFRRGMYRSRRVGLGRDWRASCAGDVGQYRRGGFEENQIYARVRANRMVWRHPEPKHVYRSCWQCAKGSQLQSCQPKSRRPAPDGLDRRNI